MIDTFKDMESEIMEWKKFLMLSLERHFKKAVQSAGESSEKRWSCTKSQPLKSKLSEGGFQGLPACEKKRLKGTITL